MSRGSSGGIARGLEAWSRLVRRHRFLVLALTVAAAAGSAWLAASRLGISTDTESLFSSDLPWRTAMDRYEEAFPHAGHSVLVVIDGPSPAVASRSQRRLVRRLERADTLFASVHAPGGGPYFERYGLLFRTPEQLRSVASRVERYGDLLVRLEREPTLPTLAAALDSTLEAARGGDDLDLRPLFGLLGEAFSVHGRPPVAWSDLFGAGRPTASDRRRFVIARPHRDHALLTSGRQSVDVVREAVAELGLERPGTEVRLTGQIPMRLEELRSARQGAVTAGLLAVLLVAVVLYLGLGSWRLILAALATLGVGLAATAAWAAVAVGHLNLISVAFAVLYLGLGIDYAIHLALRYRELRADGTPHDAALDGALQDVGPSLLLSAVTTAVAFFSFTVTDFVGLSELGVISGGGMFVSLAVTLTTFPALLDLVPLGEAAARGRVAADRGLDALATGLERHGRRVFGGFLLLGAAGLALTPSARFDPNPLRLRDPGAESVATYRELLRSEGTSPLTMTLLRPSAGRARAAADSAAALGAVRSTRTLRDFVPTRQGEKLPILARIRSTLGPAPPDSAGPRATGVDEGTAAVDRIRRALADYRPHATEAERRALRFASLRMQQWTWLVSLWEEEAERGYFVRRLEENLLGTLPGAVADLRRGLAREPVTRSDLPEELVRRWVSADGRHRVEVVPRRSLAEPEALEAFVRDVRARFPDATGAPVVQHQAGVVAVRAFRTALGVAAAGTLLVLLLTLRSARRAGQVALPLAVAALMTVGASVALGIPFNFANIIALPLLLGVGVDNGIHMVHRHRITPEGTSLLRTSTARAVLVSFLTTIVSFGNLGFSPHRGMASMGRLLAVGMITVLAATLVLLPLLLRPPGAGD